jgi:hypothetical protein
LIVGTTTDNGSDRLQVTGSATFSSSVTATQFGANTTSFVSSVFKLQVGDGTTDSRAYFNSNNAFALAVSNSSSNAYYLGVATSGLTSSFQIYNVSALTVPLTITYGGNVLIGTTTDNGTDKLQVSGSANITGNLTVDTNTLFVDSANNRVGIGTTSPTNRLDVSGAIGVNTSGQTRTISTFYGAGSDGQNIFIGGGGLSSGTGGGASSLGSYNTAVGVNGLLSNTTGRFNTATGVGALQSNTTGSSNTADGVNALQSNTTGSSNTATGVGALQNNTTGSSNTADGVNALRSNTTGSNNLALGLGAGRFITGGATANTITNQSIFIGYDTRAAASNQTNQIVIGYQETGLGSNTTIIGNSSTVTTALRGRLILGTTTDNGTDRLQVTGSANITGNLTVDTNTLFVDSVNNRVGIGTTSPAEKLDVSGIIKTNTQTGKFLLSTTDTIGATQSIEINNSVGDRRMILGFGNTSSDLMLVSNDRNADMAFRTNATERMRITSGGNVGIGTTSPAQLLHLYKPSGSVLLALQSSTNYGYFYNDGTNIGLASDIGSTGLKLIVNRSAPDNSLVIASTGAATFSSSVTASSLIKSGGTAAQILAADGSVITAGTNITISGGTISASGGGTVTGTGTTNYIPKWTSASALGNSNIQDSGTLVTISSTASEMLKINSSNASGGYISFYDSGAGVASSYIGAGAALISGLLVSDIGIASIGSVGVQVGGSGAFLINPLGGNTLIGTTIDDSTNELQVAGSIKATTGVDYNVLKPTTTTSASTATLTPNLASGDTFTITAQAAGLSVANPTGTVVNGQKMIIRIKDNGTARAITWSGTQYRASTDLALPTTTIINKTMYLGFIWNSTDSKWDMIAFLNNF